MWDRSTKATESSAGEAERVPPYAVAVDGHASTGMATAPVLGEEKRHFSEFALGLEWWRVVWEGDESGCLCVGPDLVDGRWENRLVEDVGVEGA